MQFRLPLADYAVLQALADEAELSPKDFVIQLTMACIDEHRARFDEPSSPTPH